jgi:DNA-binding LytR/AlgR family response regulator
MIKIAICDDEEKELDNAVRMCNEYMELHPEHNLKISPFVFSGELMLELIQNEPYEIALLDIYMPGMSGMDLAHYIRGKNNETQIIFLTTSSAHAVEAFSLHAAHYLVKPFTKTQFEDALSKAINSCEKNKKTQIVLKTSEGVQRINFKEFLYSETEVHIQKIYLTGKRCLRVRIACIELFELLSNDNRFYKCGSTYILNLAKIKEVTSHYILFADEMKIPMQRRQYRELIDRYTIYALEGNS